MHMYHIVCESCLARGLAHAGTRHANKQLAHWQLLTSRLCCVQDSIALDVGIPTADTDVGGTNDVYDTSAQLVGEIQIFRFKRKLNTGMCHTHVSCVDVLCRCVIYM